MVSKGRSSFVDGPQINKRDFFHHDNKATNNNTTNNSSSNSSDISNNSSKKTARITFDINDKSTKTYKEHVQELWNKTKGLWIEDSKKNYSDEEYVKLGKEIDEAWVNLQGHTSIASNGHDDKVQDTSDNVLGNMVGNIIGDTDKIYAQRSLSSSKEEISKRRKDALTNLSATIKEYDDILAKVTVK